MADSALPTTSPLKPCPFCGNKALRFANAGEHIEEGSEVRCSSCSAELWAPSRAEAIALWNERTPTDLAQHIERQKVWSEQTFGPGVRLGVIEHIRNELREVEADPLDLSEWIDVAILALDGAWRAGHSPEAIVTALAAKQARNEARTWPDWRKFPSDRAIEHDRGAEALVNSPPRVVEIRVEDWSRLYVDGQMVHEGHNTRHDNWVAVLRSLGIPAISEYLELAEDTEEWDCNGAYRQMDERAAKLMSRVGGGA